MSFLRTLYRAIFTLGLFLTASVELLIIRPKTRPERAAWLSRFCRRVLRTLGVTWSTSGPVPTSGAVIANHLSFFDIVLHAAVRPCVFVSKIELRKTPLLGWMSMMSGTVYVVRGGGGSASAAAEGMAKGFRDGLPVVFFPEGTTGVGDVPALPFRSGLLAQTIAADVPIHASFVTYALSAQDLAAGYSLRNDLHWGNQSMLHMMWRFFQLHGLHAHVAFAGQAIAFTPAAVANRKVAAVEAHEAVVHLAAAPASWTVNEPPPPPPAP